MAGVRSAPSDANPVFVTGMKRTHSGATAPSYGEPHPKKRRIAVHKLRHTQPIEHIPEPVSAEVNADGEYKEFFGHQLKRAIAISCKGVGFETSTPEALEEFRGMVDEYMRHFLAQVRKSMSSARRTSTVAQDWIYALTSTGHRGSSILEQHLDTAPIPPSILQPQFAPPEPAEPPPPNLETLLGPTLSGAADKEERKWVPPHFPPFPSKHTYKATPVFTERETDPRKIREKATQEGIVAEQSLRELMKAQKRGIQKKGRQRSSRQSMRIKKSDALWEAAMKDLMAEEEQAKKRRETYDEMDDAEGEPDGDEFIAAAPLLKSNKEQKKINLEEVGRVNYEQQFWRKSARE